MMVGDWLNRLRRTQPSTAQTTGVKGSGVAGAGARNGLSRVETTLFKNPTTPTTGATMGAMGVAGTTDGVTRALLSLVAANVFNVGITLDEFVSVDDEAVAVTAVLGEVVGVEAFDNTVAAADSTEVECDADSGFAAAVVC